MQSAILIVPTSECTFAEGEGPHLHDIPLEKLCQ